MFTDQVADGLDIHNGVPGNPFTDTLGYAVGLMLLFSDGRPGEGSSGACVSRNGEFTTAAPTCTILFNSWPWFTARACSDAWMGLLTVSPQLLHKRGHRSPAHPGEYSA